jgi:hypothetical protein
VKNRRLVVVLVGVIIKQRNNFLWRFLQRQRRDHDINRATSKRIDGSVELRVNLFLECVCCLFTIDASADILFVHIGRRWISTTTHDVMIRCANERSRRAALCETAVLLFSLEATESSTLERMLAGASVIPMLSGET